MLAICSTCFWKIITDITYGACSNGCQQTVLNYVVSTGTTSPATKVNKRKLGGCVFPVTNELSYRSRLVSGKAELLPCTDVFRLSIGLYGLAIDGLEKVPNSFVRTEAS